MYLILYAKFNYLSYISHTYSSLNMYTEMGINSI